MIKIFLGFLVFCALAIFILMKGGDIDMGGEKHGIDHPAEAASAPASAAASAAAPAASVALPAASGASQ